MTGALIVLVIASGFGGMLLARHFAHPVGLPRSYPVAAQAPSSSPASPATRVGATGGSSAPSAANAGQVQESPPATAAPVNAEVAPPPAGSPGAVTEDEEVGLALRRWQTALLSNNAAQIAPSYSVRVKRYFLQQDVTRTYVEQYMTREEASGFRLRKYELRKVAIEHVGRHAVDVHFVASFTAETPGGTRSASTRTLLKMHQEDGDWKIYFERDYSG